MVLYCCSAYRAMNAAALATYEAIRRDGTQKNVLDRMQTRADLYKYLDYHAYEAKLDQLFARGQEHEECSSASTRRPTQAEEIRGPVRRGRRQHGAVHGRARPATICTTAATTSSTSRRTANSRRSPICWCTAICRTRRELAAYKAQAAGPARPAGSGAHGARAAARRAPPDGRDAHRGLGARLRAAGSGRHHGRRRARHRRPAARLARFDAALLVSLRHAAARIEVETDDDTHRRPFSAPAARQRAAGLVGARDAHLADSLRRARVQRLDLHRPGHRRHGLRHLLVRSRAASARCAGPSTAAPTRWLSRSSSATPSPDEAEADIRRRVAAKEVIIGFGHPVYTIADPAQRDHQGGRRARSREAAGDTQGLRIAERIEAVMMRRQEHVPEPRLVSRPCPTT